MGGHCQQNEINPRSRTEMMGLMVSQKPAGFDLMQNCDLPPPSKLLMRSDDAVTLSSSTTISTTVGQQPHARDFSSCDGDDKVELLRALRSSQTRAREAENKAAILSKERDCLSVVLLREAMRLFAYRQQLRLLQFQVSNLQSQCLEQQQQDGPVGLHKEDDDDEEKAKLPWTLALALSFGVGVGTALAFRYFL